MINPMTINKDILKAVSVCIDPRGRDKLTAACVYQDGDNVVYAATNGHVLISFKCLNTKIAGGAVQYFNKKGEPVKGDFLTPHQFQRPFPSVPEPTQEIGLSASYMAMLDRSLRALKIKNRYTKMTLHGEDRPAVYTRAVYHPFSRLDIDGEWTALIMPLRV